MYHLMFVLSLRIKQPAEIIGASASDTLDWSDCRTAVRLSIICSSVLQALTNAFASVLRLVFLGADYLEKCSQITACMRSIYRLSSI